MRLILGDLYCSSEYPSLLYRRSYSDKMKENNLLSDCVSSASLRYTTFGTKTLEEIVCIIWVYWRPTSKNSRKGLLDLNLGLSPSSESNASKSRTSSFLLLWLPSILTWMLTKLPHTVHNNGTPHSSLFHENELQHLLLWQILK